MPIVLKIDGSTVEPLSEECLDVSTMIRKHDPDARVGDVVFIWSHYTQPAARDGQLIALGVLVRFERSADCKSASLRVALSKAAPARTWRTADLDTFKKLGDGSPETEIADEVRGYTHDHLGYVSDGAAELMAGYFA